MRILISLIIAFCAATAAAQTKEPVNVTRDFEPFSRHPDVAYDTLNRRFYVVWQTDDGDVLGRWVERDGTLGPRSVIFKAQRGTSHSLRFDLPAVAFHAEAAPDGDDALFVFARMTQRFIFSSGVVNGVEMVGRRLDLDGAPQTQIIGLSNTSPIGPTPVPAGSLDGGPDIAAPDGPGIGPPLVVWAQGPEAMGRWWPEGRRDAPFQLYLRGKNSAYDNPCVTFQPEGRNRPPRYVTVFGEDDPNFTEAVTVVPTEIGSTAPGAPTQVAFATPPTPGVGGGGAPARRQDATIAWGGETLYVGYGNQASGRNYSERVILKGDAFEASRPDFVPFLYFITRSEQYPAVAPFRGGFVAAYDFAALGGYSVGLILSDAVGRKLQGFGVSNSSRRRNLFERKHHLSIAATTVDELVGIAWNTAEGPGSGPIEPEIWLSITSPPP